MLVFSVYMWLYGIGFCEFWFYGDVVFNVVFEVFKLRYKFILYLKEIVEKVL